MNRHMADLGRKSQNRMCATRTCVDARFSEADVVAVCMENRMPYKHVTIEPWIGDYYGRNRSVFAKKVLVLGEAEYGTTLGQKASKADTQFCISREAIPNGGRLYSVVAGLLTGRLPESERDRVSFWHSIIYYNYVQEHAGFGPESHPVRKCGQMERYRSSRSFTSTVQTTLWCSVFETGPTSQARRWRAGIF